MKDEVLPIRSVSLARLSLPLVAGQRPLPHDWPRTPKPHPRGPVPTPHSGLHDGRRRPWSTGPARSRGSGHQAGARGLPVPLEAPGSGTTRPAPGITDCHAGAWDHRPPVTARLCRPTAQAMVGGDQAAPDAEALGSHGLPARGDDRAHLAKGEGRPVVGGPPPPASSRPGGNMRAVSPRQAAWACQGRLVGPTGWRPLRSWGGNEQPRRPAP